jgi:sulfur carrier protein
MTVILNGEPAELALDTVYDLLAARGIDPSVSGVAVAINDRVVRRTEWAKTAISDGDRIEVITAMQGG